MKLLKMLLQTTRDDLKDAEMLVGYAEKAKAMGRDDIAAMFLSRASRRINEDYPNGKRVFDDLMEKLRKAPPVRLGEIDVKSVSDYSSSVKLYKDGKKELINLPKANVLKYDLGGDMWACVRPSGTEPKLKIYVSTVAENAEKAEALNKKIQQELEKECLL